jgi:hypothetical protein
MARSSISPVDELAENFRQITDRLDSLERAVNTGLVLADLDARYVNVPGDTMTGALILPTTADMLRFGSTNESLARHTAAGARPWYTAGIRLKGQTGWSFYAVDQALDVMGYRGGGAAASRYAWADRFAVTPSGPNDADLPSGYVMSVNGGHLALHGANQLVFYTYGGSIYMNDTTWIRTGGNKNFYVNNVIGCTYLSVNVGGAPTAGYIAEINGQLVVRSNLRCTNGGQVEATRDQIGDPYYYNNTFYGNPAAGGSGISWHPSGTAPQLRVAASDNNVYARDAGGNNYIPLYASAFVVSSQRASKRAIRAWFHRDAEPTAMDTVRKLRPVRYRQHASWMRELPKGRRHEAFVRLSRYTHDRGLPDYELPEHDCTAPDSTCPGTAERPCGRRLDYEQGMIGLVAEDVAEVFPEAVAHTADGEPGGINYAALTILLLQALRETEERVRQLEDRLAITEQETA